MFHISGRYTFECNGFLLCVSLQVWLPWQSFVAGRCRFGRCRCVSLQVCNSQKKQLQKFKNYCRAVLDFLFCGNFPPGGNFNVFYNLTFCFVVKPCL